MSNPARAPKNPTLEQLRLSSAPDAFLPEGFDKLARSYKTVETAQSVLSRLDMEVEKPFVIPRELTVDPRVLTSAKPVHATAKVGVPRPRIRSAFAKQVVSAAFAALPAEGPFSKSVVGAAMVNRVFVDAGAEGTLGRILKAYPARGVRPRHPITDGEAEAAVGRCGLILRHLPAPALRPYPIVAKEGEVSVTVNAKSDNGFPVLGQWSTPGAAALAHSLAMTLGDELRRTDDVEGWLRRAEAERPYLVAVRGKAKGDYYAPEKVVGACMRFYNAFPRQVMLLMQQATQVMEQHASNILTGNGHSGIGVSLVRGGAGDLVLALESQLARREQAYVHVGDDSWVIVRRGPKVCMFALDCSNFDLTQHNTVTRAVHRAIRDELALVDRKAADLWHAYARERVVVLTGQLVRRFKHAGPSGMPLQSKVNDALMDVMITRALALLEGGELSETRVASVVEEVGQGMGFVVKLEQFWLGRAESILEALEQRPFLFIGYYFHVRGGVVRVCTDVPRTFAQVPYPSLAWSKADKDLQITEAMRLGSIVLNLGLPTIELEGAFAAFRHEAVLLVERTVARFGDATDERLRWAVQESPFGAATVPSLAGLLRVLKEPVERLWLVKEVELPSFSEFLPVEGWADEVENEERREVAAAGAVWARPPADLSIRRIYIPPGRATTHPATLANDGRVAPTVVWGPPKAPRDRAPSRRERRKDVVRREWAEAEETLQDWSDDSDEY